LFGGRAASFIDGKWKPGFLFENKTFLNEFVPVQDPDEIAHIMEEAADALAKSVEGWDGY